MHMKGEGDQAPHSSFWWVTGRNKQVCATLRGCCRVRESRGKGCHATLATNRITSLKISKDWQLNIFNDHCIGQKQNYKIIIASLSLQHPCGWYTQQGCLTMFAALPLWVTTTHSTKELCQLSLLLSADELDLEASVLIPASLQLLHRM